MNTVTLIARITRIEARLENIEHHLNLSTTAPPDRATAPSAIGPVPPTSPRPVVVPESTPEPLAPPTLTSAKRSATARLFKPTKEKESRALGIAFDSHTLENLIAGRWMAWIGSLVVVIGAGFLAKLAFDAGLWGMLSPTIRCISLALFGGVLIGGGEYTLRKWGRPAAVGLLSAGLGVWFLTAYATAMWYQLLPEFAAWLLMALVASAGFALTLRARSLTIGVLTLIAAYGTPLLLHRAASDPIVLPLYLTAVFSVPLALSAFRPRPYRPLRFVALGGQALLGAVWLIWRADPWAVVVFFGGLWWVMLTAEALYAAHRQQTRIGNALATLLGTALFVTGACITIHTSLAGAAPYWSGALTLCVAALAVVAAVQFGSGLEPLRTRPTEAIGLLTIALWLQAAVLLTVAAALFLDDLALTVAWLAVGLAGVETGRRMHSTLTDAFGLSVLTLAAFKSITIDALMASGIIGGGATILIEVDPIGQLTDFSLVLFIVTGVLTAASYRLRDDVHRLLRIAPIALAVSASMFYLLATGCTFINLWLTGTWLVAAAILLTRYDLTRRQHGSSIGLVLAFLTLAKWMVVDTALPLLPPGAPDAALPFINAPFLFGLVLAGGVAAWWYRIRTIDSSSMHQLSLPSTALRSLLPALTAFIVAWAIGFEIERLVDRHLMKHPASPWTHVELLGFWLMMLTGAIGCALSFTARRLDTEKSARVGVGMLVLATGAWLTSGTLIPALLVGVTQTAAFFNPQFIAGTLLLMMIIATLRGWSFTETGTPVPDSMRVMRYTLLGFMGAIPLWLGTLEVARLVPDAISIYWGLYGIGLVVLGWMRPTAIIRHAGLALLLLTLGKVLIVDTAQLEGIARPLSYLVIGLLFVLTSIGYARLSPKLAARISPHQGEMNSRDTIPQSRREQEDEERHEHDDDEQRIESDRNEQS